MILAMNYFKLVVRDVAVTERFYRTLGMKVVSRNTGGEEEVAQEQCWLSVTGDASACVLILSRFTELPMPERPSYPGEVWLVFNVADIDATCQAVEQAGGSIFRPGQDRPEHGVRAAVVRDPEGHHIELVGPMNAG